MELLIKSITVFSFLCLVIVSLNGIAENMTACWPLAFVTSTGMVSLAFIEVRKKLVE